MRTQGQARFRPGRAGRAGSFTAHSCSEKCRKIQICPGSGRTVFLTRSALRLRWPQMRWRKIKHKETPCSEVWFKTKRKPTASRHNFIRLLRAIRFGLFRKSIMAKAPVILRFLKRTVRCCRTPIKSMSVRFCAFRRAEKQRQLKPA